MDSITEKWENSDFLKIFSGNLHTEFIGKDILFFSLLNSTNDFAKEKLENLRNGTVIIADGQLLGRGSMGRSWFSPKGLGLWFTILMKNPSIPQDKLSLINLMASLVVTKSIEALCFLTPQIKWPNDLFLGDKKVCGILSEYYRSSLIVGIGLNIGKNISFPNGIKANAIECDDYYFRETLLKKILETFEEFCALSHDAMLIEWFRYAMNGNVSLIDLEKTIPCKIIGPGPSGELLLRDENGEIRSVYSGEQIIWEK